MLVKEAYKELGLRGNEAWRDVQHHYRRAVMSAHPDKGGDVDEFVVLKQAYEVLEEHYATRPCAACNGRGRVVMSCGFRTLERECEVCLGKGYGV